MSRSDCCGALDGEATEDGPSWSDVGICPDCREHCEFVEEEDGRKLAILSSLSYWIDLETCVCKVERPIGSCCKCDLEEVKKYIEENT